MSVSRRAPVSTWRNTSVAQTHGLETAEGAALIEWRANQPVSLIAANEPAADMRPPTRGASVDGMW